jgi:hypothetical protein
MSEWWTSSSVASPAARACLTLLLVRAVLLSLPYPNDFSGCPNEHFGAPSYFGGKNHREILLGTSTEILVDCEGEIKPSAEMSRVLPFRETAARTITGTTSQIVVRGAVLSFEAGSAHKRSTSRNTLRSRISSLRNSGNKH